MAKRSPGMELAGNLIPKSMRALGEKADRLYRTHYALRHLPDLIGSSFAEHIHPLGVRHKKLFIHVPEDSWRSEIWMFREEIRNRINQCAGEEIVQEIISTYQRNIDLEQKTGEQGKPGGEELLEKKSARTELRQVNLTDEEMEELRLGCSSVRDPELRKRLFSLSMKRKKLEKLKKRKEWHPCSGCGTLCPPEEACCPSCTMRNRRRMEEQIKKLLTELPWLRYPEIKKTISCTPGMVDSIRDSLIQQVASKVHLEDVDTLDAYTLVMLYLHIPPENITEELVRKTLYRLRNDLAKPKEFKPYKRYDVIPFRKSERKKERISGVSSSRK